MSLIVETSQTPARRRGRFVKGMSGNPKGRPKAEISVVKLARERGMEAFEKLLALMHCGKPDIELRAAEAVLDRAYGRPRQSGDDGRPQAQIVIHTTLDVGGERGYVIEAAPDPDLLPP